MSNVRGTVSKALLMSIVARSVRCAGFGELRPSCIVCVRVVRRVVVECRARNPCCVGERGMCGVMFVRISLSSILTGLGRRDIGLYEAGSVGVLLGLSIGMILAVFQRLGMLLLLTEKLKMEVRAPMATGPKCLRCR